MKHLHKALPPTSNARTVSVMKTFQGRLKFPALVLLLLAVCCLLLPTRAFAAPPNPNPQVFPPNSTPFGNTYGVWSNLWWQWVLSIPEGTNPAFDTTGADCGVNQFLFNPDVWFLAGVLGGSSTPITRACTVPAGKALFFPIVNDVDVGINPDCSVSDDTKGTLGAGVNKFIAKVKPNTFAAQGDGQALQDLRDFRVGPSNPPFTVTDPVLLGNLLGCSVSGMSYLAVNDGYYLMLEPLSAGTHTIHFVLPSGPSPQDITYNLTVEG